MLSEDMVSKGIGIGWNRSTRGQWKAYCSIKTSEGVLASEQSWRCGGSCLYQLSNWCVTLAEISCNVAIGVLEDPYLGYRELKLSDEGYGCCALQLADERTQYITQVVPFF